MKVVSIDFLVQFSRTSTECDLLSAAKHSHTATHQANTQANTLTHTHYSLEMADKDALDTNSKLKVWLIKVS